MFKNEISYIKTRVYSLSAHIARFFQKVRCLAQTPNISNLNYMYQVRKSSKKKDCCFLLFFYIENVHILQPKCDSAAVS